MSVSSSDASPTCSGCGVPRPPGVEGVAREPCPECGETGLTYALTIAAEVDVAASITPVMTPGDQAETWQSRWALVQARLATIDRVHPAPMQGTAIKEAGQELLEFFVLAYHLKERLEAEPSIPPDDVYKMMKASPALCLLADLANLTKHVKLERKTWSGSLPVVGKAHGAGSGDGSVGWTLRLDITHDGKLLDALDVARDAVAAWEAALRGWGLI